MKTHRVLLSAAALGLLAGLFSPALADTITLAPAQTAVLPAAAHDAAVAMTFDLSGLRSGEGRQIDEAFLVWNAGSVSGDLTTAIEVRGIAAAWTTARVAEGTPVSLAEAPAARWRLDRVVQGWTSGLVRLDVTELVRGWAASPATNHGLLIRFGELGRDAAGRQATRPRMVVRYGFRK